MRRKVVALRCRSASFRRRTLAAQSEQYFPRLDLGTKAAPQTAHRFRLPRIRGLRTAPHRGAGQPYGTSSAQAPYPSLPRKRSFMVRGVAGVSAALAAFCSKTVKTAARSKSSPSFRAVMGFCPVRREVGQPTTALLDGPRPPAAAERKIRQKLAAVARAFRMVCRSFSLFVSNLVCRGVIPPAIMGAFCLSSAACPFFCAQYSRSVTRFLLPFRRSIW